MKTFLMLLASRPWIAHIDDKRNDGGSIIVTLASGWFFADETNCGVRGFDSVLEVRDDTRRRDVMEVIS